MTPPSIDLNLDAGESAIALMDGSEAKLYDFVTSVNIACGGHAGDSATMAQAVELARQRQLQVGAHPGFPDKAGFGRSRQNLDHADLVASLSGQIETLALICRRQNVRLQHVKPHGALYNLAADDEETAGAVMEAVRRVDPELLIVGLADSPFLKWCKAANLNAAGEAFADRQYLRSGRLQPREEVGALIGQPDVAANQAISIAKEGLVTALGGQKIPVHAKTLCVHGDSANAYLIAKTVNQALKNSGIQIRPFSVKEFETK